MTVEAAKFPKKMLEASLPIQDTRRVTDSEMMLLLRAYKDFTQQKDIHEYFGISKTTR
jgi:hypothetical protein